MVGGWRWLGVGGWLVVGGVSWLVVLMVGYRWFVDGWLVVAGCFCGGMASGCCCFFVSEIADGAILLATMFDHLVWFVLAPISFWSRLTISSTSKYCGSLHNNLPQTKKTISVFFAQSHRNR